jgi:hypothetical protein
MPTTRETVPATAADHMPLPGNHIPSREILDVRAHFYNRPNEFMTDNHRDRYGFLRPSVPRIDMQIGAANPRFLNSNQAVVNANLRKWHVLKLQPHTPMMLD